MSNSCTYPLVTSLHSTQNLNCFAPPRPPVQSNTIITGADEYVSSLMKSVIQPSAAPLQQEQAAVKLRDLKQNSIQKLPQYSENNVETLNKDNFNNSNIINNNKNNNNNDNVKISNSDADTQPKNTTMETTKNALKTSRKFNFVDWPAIAYQFSKQMMMEHPYTMVIILIICIVLFYLGYIYYMHTSDSRTNLLGDDASEIGPFDKPQKTTRSDAGSIPRPVPVPPKAEYHPLPQNLNSFPTLPPLPPLPPLPAIV